MVVANGVTVACFGVGGAAAANEASAALAADSIAGPRGSAAVWERTEEVREAKQYGGMVVRVVVIVAVAMGEGGRASVGLQLFRGLGKAPERYWRKGKRWKMYQVRCHEAGGAGVTVFDYHRGGDG